MAVWATGGRMASDVCRKIFNGVKWEIGLHAADGGRPRIDETAALDVLDNILVWDGLNRVLESYWENNCGVLERTGELVLR
jgi:hypothetical protein